jgi:NADPH:quinone reductase-like Zn-dependent oxidoreductase
MKAIVTTCNGSPQFLELREVPTPVPAADQLLIKVRASSLNPLDGYTMKGPVFFSPSISGRMKVKYPILGADFAGEVVTVGKDIQRFRPGDQVFGASSHLNGLGAFAQYLCTKEDSLALKPANLSFEQAAAVPVAALTALQGLRDSGKIQPGQTVLIDGASGGVGSFAVQIAKALGATVTAVCSPRNVDTARSIGADRVIDYTQEDFTLGRGAYDLIFGANVHHSIFDYTRILRPGGTFVLAGGELPQVLKGLVLGPLLSRIGSRKFRFFIAKINAADLNVLSEFLEARKIVSVIDRCYPLAETADAMRYREEGHARGKVVITISHQPSLEQSSGLCESLRPESGSGPGDT